MQINEMKHGVPEDPMLFFVHINDLPEISIHSLNLYSLLNIGMYYPESDHFLTDCTAKLTRGLKQMTY
jgi:hypothetical protein